MKPGVVRLKKSLDRLTWAMRTSIEAVAVWRNLAGRRGWVWVGIGRRNDGVLRMKRRRGGGEEGNER